LVIEIDGSSHDHERAREKDAGRDRIWRSKA
jgi:very-short-patch-repair endonuclease